MDLLIGSSMWLLEIYRGFRNKMSRVMWKYLNVVEYAYIYVRV